MSVLFYVGLHQPGDASNFDRACISINRLRRRKKPVACKKILVDGAGFTTLVVHGDYIDAPEAYARELHRLHAGGVVQIEAAVTQDYMCEPFMLAKTGLTIEEHQRRTVERYDAILAELMRLFGVTQPEDLPFHLMPVLQGYDPQDYVRHIRMYGDRLKPGMWVGVGSVCKRNGSPEKVVEVLAAIKAVRPDLRLHGFGVKLTSLMHPGVRDFLYSADSMAWSFAARKQGRDGNAWTEAKRFAARVSDAASRAFEPWQMPLPLLRAA